MLKIAPLGWIHGQLPFTTEWRIGYERRIAPRATLGVSYSYLGTNYPFSFIGAFALSTAISAAITSAGHPGIVWTDARVRAHGARYQAQYRQYLSRKRRAPEGWYLSPHFSYAEVTYDVRVEDLTAQIDLTNRTYDLLFGHQRVLGQHFVFDIFTGLGYRDKRTVVRGLAGVRPDERLSANHFKLSSGLNLGWAF